MNLPIPLSLSLSFGWIRVCCRKLPIEKNSAAPLTVHGNALPSSRIAQQRDRIARIDRCGMQTRFARWFRAASLIRRNIARNLFNANLRGIFHVKQRGLSGEISSRSSWKRCDVEEDSSILRFCLLLIINFLKISSPCSSTLSCLSPFFLLSSFSFFFFSPRFNGGELQAYVNFVNRIIRRSIDEGRETWSAMGRRSKPGDSRFINMRAEKLHFLREPARSPAIILQRDNEEIENRKEILSKIPLQV